MAPARQRVFREPTVTPLLVGVLGFLSMGSALATDVYLPALPDIAGDLTVSPALAQMTLTVFIIAQAFGNLIVGPMSDRWGRWWPLLASNAVFVLAGIGAALASDIWVLIAMRAIQGAGSAAGPVIARAVVADLTEGARAARLFGLLMMLFGLAPVVAPVLGGPLTEWGGWQGAMWGIVVVSVLALLSNFILPESLPARQRRKVRLSGVFGDFSGLVRNRYFFTCALLVMSAFGIIMAWLSASSFVLQEHFGLTPSTYALVFGVNASGFLLAGLLNALLLRRFSSKQVLTASVFICASGAVALLVLALIDALPLWLLVTLVTLTFAATSPLMANATALGLGSVNPREVGTASAFLGTIEFLLPAILAPLIGVFGTAPTPMLVAFAVYGALGLLLYLTLIRHPRHQQQV